MFFKDWSFHIIMFSYRENYSNVYSVSKNNFHRSFIGSLEDASIFDVTFCIDESLVVVKAEYV